MSQKLIEETKEIFDNGYAQEEFYIQDEVVGANDAPELDLSGKEEERRADKEELDARGHEQVQASDQKRDGRRNKRCEFSAWRCRTW